VNAAFSRMRALVWRGVRWPYQMVRRWISAQLVAAHLLVIFLTVLVLYALPTVVLLGWMPPWVIGDDEAFLDFSLGEKARTVAVLLQAETVAGEPHAALGDPDCLGAVLRRVVDRGQAAAPNGDSSRHDAGIALPGVDYALLAAPDGTILASSDEGWAPPGQPVEAATFSLVGALTRDTIARDGAINPEYDEAWDVGGQDSVAVGSFPLVIDNRLIGVVTLQGEPLAFGDVPGIDVFLEVVAADFVTILPLLLLAAVLVAVPVGVWRSRAVAGRLSLLAAAADAMAAGDLGRRIDPGDADEIGRLGERFNEMAERLAAADRGRRSFVANISHELRTPVAIVRAHSELLLAHGDAGRGVLPTIAGGDESAEKRAALETIHRETLTLGRLIDDLFTLARMEEAVLPLETGVVDLCRVASEVVDGVRALAWDERRVTVRSVVPVDLPSAWGDQTRLRQVLNNLIFNALRYTPEGGLIVIDGRYRAGEEAVELSVSDTGVGIPPEQMTAIFDRFQQGGRPGGEEEGSGLGLHIVKHLIEAQGGNVWVERVAGPGAMFRFALPLAR